MKKLIGYMAAVLFLMVLVSCNSTQNEPVFIIGQDAGHWEELREQKKLNSCDAVFGYGGYSYSATFGTKGKISSELYDMFKQIDAEPCEFDMAGYFDSGRLFYELKLDDTGGDGLSGETVLGFYFFDDCRYAAPIDGEGTYLIKNPETVIDILKEQDLYLSPQVAEMLDSRTEAFLDEYNTLSEILDSGIEVSLQTDGNDGITDISSAVPENYDVSITDHVINICTYPGRKGTPEHEHAYYTRIYVSTPEWDMPLDIAYDESGDGLKMGKIEAFIFNKTIDGQ
ncbi:MAG: hypothetical protein IJG64_00420 [Oscillospiraceae bacterium]|nr:hypothetical protein [Oscillospiraceae bacterium]